MEKAEGKEGEGRVEADSREKKQRWRVQEGWWREGREGGREDSSYPGVPALSWGSAWLRFLSLSQRHDCIPLFTHSHTLLLVPRPVTPHPPWASLSTPAHCLVLGRCLHVISHTHIPHTHTYTHLQALNHSLSSSPLFPPHSPSLPDISGVLLFLHTHSPAHSLALSPSLFLFFSHSPFALSLSLALPSAAHSVSISLSINIFGSQPLCLITLFFYLGPPTSTPVFTSLQPVCSQRYSIQPQINTLDLTKYIFPEHTAMWPLCGLHFFLPTADE